MPISFVTASGKEIAAIVEQIEDVIAGMPTIQVSIACIVVAALAQNPEVSPDKLQEVVRTVSEVMSASLFTDSQMVN